MYKKLQIINRLREIKFLRHIVGWTIPYFASSYLIEVRDDDVEEKDIEKFKERVKKQLGRVTYSEGKLKDLKSYIDFIKSTSEYRNSPLAQELEFKELVGSVDDYKLLLNENGSKESEDILSVAILHALSIGGAWDFKIKEPEENEDDLYYRVTWLGCLGFDDDWKEMACTIVKDYSGHLFVRSVEEGFDKTQYRGGVV